MLTKSGISDYSVNCYVGCLHNCVYCYARYMSKFTNHCEAWGQFLDVKVNAADVLAREVKRKPTGKIFFSSACDGWQPAERKYELTRRCLKIATDAGFPIRALSKSNLIERDIDIFAASVDATFGCTITTLDESLRRRIEIAASSSEARLKALEKAKSAGVRTWAFCGPLLPELTDSRRNIEAVISRLADADVDSIIVDKLNFRSGVYESIISMLGRFYPELIPKYHRLFSNRQEYDEYAYKLRVRVKEVAACSGLNGKLEVIIG